MLARRRIIEVKILCWKGISARYSTRAAEQLSTHYDKRLAHRLERKEARKPFAKGLLVGDFDMEICAFPEAQSSDRNASFFEWLKPIEELMCDVDARAIDREKKIADQLLDKLNELGVFGAYIDEEFGGLGLLESEYMKLLETLAKVPALALMLAKINKCVDLIAKNASQEQKMKWLPGIATGRVIPTYCVSESRTSGDTNSMINCRATLVPGSTDQQEQFCLTGEKLFVPNAERANLFVTFALCAHKFDSFNVDKTLSLLLVPADNKHNIKLSEPIDVVGIRGLAHFNVSFNQVMVARDNLVGRIGDANNMYVDFMSSRKHDSSAVSLGILRNFIDTLTAYMTTTQHLNKKLCEFDSAKEVLANATHSLYCMESATYLTTALMDLHTNQDVQMECNILQNYCTVECAARISEGIHLIGTPAYLTNNIYDLLFRDAHALTLFEHSVIDSEALTALIGLQHVGKLMNQAVYKLRNPFHFPMFNLLFDRRLNLRIADHLHPSLEAPAKTLEELLFILKDSTVDLLVKHGAFIADQHMDLRRLYQLASMTYVFSSVLARASRAYCIGLRHSDHDLQMAQTLAYKLKVKAATLSEEIEKGGWFSGDHTNKEITATTLQNRQYVAAHPLTRNF